MTDATISLRVSKDIRNKMREHDEVNWSSVLRKAIAENLENRERVNLERRRKACEEMNKLVKTKAFDRGKDSVLIIREWRNKRR